ncbi:MAG: hypothetical protein N2Z70_03310, partial [Bdellovibrionaceae bacterium]|nr:hypothetical protein [Pseudobdellovibrionaceae bacterium]
MNSLSKWLKSTSLNLKNSSFSLWVTGISVIGLVACQAPSNTHYSLRPLEDIKPEIPNYEEPVIKQATWQNLNESQEMRYQPKVDIVFLIDNSTSMRPVQENLARNIDQFVSSLNSLRALDYQIGVMTNWDDYTTTFKQENLAISEIFIESGDTEELKLELYVPSTAEPKEIPLKIV